MNKVAILITTFNRKSQTVLCLNSLYKCCSKVSNYQFDIYLVDDKSPDGTLAMIRQTFPDIISLEGTGNLYWAGGMRLAWQTALNSGNNYNGFLLLNDDVELLENFWKKIEFTLDYSVLTYGKKALCTLSTKDKETGLLSYGGNNLEKKIFKHKFHRVVPSDIPKSCILTNGNILYVPCEIVDKIGILDDYYIHSFADFDYSLSAAKQGFPVLVCPDYGGYCTNDHGEFFFDKKISFKKRISNLYAPKGIALNQYLYYLHKHFRFKAAYAFIANWLRILFPQIIRQ